MTSLTSYVFSIKIFRAVANIEHKYLTPFVFCYLPINTSLVGWLQKQSSMCLIFTLALIIIATASEDSLLFWPPLRRIFFFLVSFNIFCIILYIVTIGRSTEIKIITNEENERHTLYNLYSSPPGGDRDTLVTLSLQYIYCIYLFCYIQSVLDTVC